MNLLMFYISGVVAVIASIMVITRSNAVHALLYLIVTLLSLSMAFFMLGAPFAAALEIIIYAGAIMVLFVFAVMMFNFNQQDFNREKQWMQPKAWIGPTLLVFILLAEIVFVLQGNTAPSQTHLVDAKQVGILLFGPYVLAVEIASFLLLAGLVGGYHLAKPDPEEVN